MRASTGSAPSLAPKEFQAQNKDVALLYRPRPIKPCSPNITPRNNSAYHTLPRSSTSIKEMDRSSSEQDVQTGSITSDEDGGFHEEQDVSLSKSQLERMSSSFPSPHSATNDSSRRETECRKLSLENLVLSDNQSETEVQNNIRRSLSPLRVEVPASGKPKTKPKPKQRHRQANNNKKNPKNENNSMSASGKRANFAVSHSRRPSQEELECEEIAKDLSQNLKESDKELINVLNPKNKRATDFVKDLLENTHLLPEISTENATNLDSQNKTDSISNW